MPVISIQHVAGDPQGSVQGCARCGTVMADHTNVMVLEGDGPPGFWKGPVFCVNGTAWAAGLDDEAVPCTPGGGHV